MRWARKARWYSPIAILHRGRAGRPRVSNDVIRRMRKLRQRLTLNETAKALGLHKCTVQKYA